MIIEVFLIIAYQLITQITVQTISYSTRELIEKAIAVDDFKAEEY